jgi:serine/threonine protein kinase
VSQELQHPVFEFDRLHKVRLIARGSQSKVNLYRNNTNGDLIAVKGSPIRDSDIIDGIVNEKLRREVQSLMKFHHPCIVSLLGHDLQIESRIMRIAMPYVGPDSLESVLKSPRSHPWLTQTSKTIIIVGIVIGMYFVHCGGIVHRDLKPANVLLDPTSHYPKIADFGLSRECDIGVTMTGGTGTPLYMAPEVIKGHRYSNKADIFSFGVLLYEIVTGQKPLQQTGGNQFQLSAKITSGSREKIPDDVEPFTAALISRCWDDDPDQRPTFLDIFDELRENDFKLFPAVDPAPVHRFLESLR